MRKEQIKSMPPSPEDLGSALAPLAPKSNVTLPALAPELVLRIFTELWDTGDIAASTCLGATCNSFQAIQDNRPDKSRFWKSRGLNKSYIRPTNADEDLLPFMQSTPERCLLMSASVWMLLDPDGDHRWELLRFESEGELERYLYPTTVPRKNKTASRPQKWGIYRA